MPKTTAMNISLPESMRDWVISQTENGQYSNNSDVVRDLIRKEQHRQEKIRRLQEAVDKGLASGVARDFDMEAVIEKMEKEQAAKYLRELNEKFVLIAENPLLNRERTELKQPIRIRHYESHIILYTTANETVHIIRVLHQSMAIEER